jgi:hypothetical protein
MRDLKNKLTSGKNTKNIKNRKGKSFGYQVLGFGAGGGAAFAPLVATGGTITESGDFKIHTFTGPGTFEVTEEGTLNEVEYMIVAGGGGYGFGYGSGGGGGGYRAAGCGPAPLQAPNQPVSVTSYPISIGAGGAGAVFPGSPSAFSPGSQGGTTSAFSLSSAGGGGGAGGPTGGYGQSGGSGGGSSAGTPGAARAGGAGNTPPVSPPQGTPGATGGNSTCGPGTEQEQGGGAVSAGGPTRIQNGAPNSINGTDTMYSTGGKSFTAQPNTPSNPVSNRPNSGFGQSGSQGQPGDAGIVIIRYRLVAE